MKNQIEQCQRENKSLKSERDSILSQMKAQEGLFMEREK
jgi:hypothetical protein